MTCYGRYMYFILCIMRENWLHFIKNMFYCKWGLVKLCCFLATNKPNQTFPTWPVSHLFRQKINTRFPFSSQLQQQCHIPFRVNSLRSGDGIWRHRSGSTLAQVMACCLTAPSHYLNQYLLIFDEILVSTSTQVCIWADYPGTTRSTVRSLI